MMPSPVASGETGDPAGTVRRVRRRVGGACHSGEVSIPNLHDVGAVAGAQTPLRTGVLYRSAELAALDRSGDALGELGVRTVVDLRTAPERTARPDVLPDAVRGIVANVFADQEDAAPTAGQAVLSDPVKSADRVHAGEVENHMIDSYTDFVVLPGARRAYATLFRQIDDADGAPLLFHCAAGKDRTGWAAAVLHQLAGLDDDQVMTAYLSVREPVLVVLRPLIEAFVRAGGHADVIRPMIDVRPAYLHAATTAMTTHFGDVRGYLSRGLGLDDATIDAVRSALVE